MRPAIRLRNAEFVFAPNNPSTFGNVAWHGSCRRRTTTFLSPSTMVTATSRTLSEYAPKWTNQSEADPGITMMELFASMTEMLLYRVNQVVTALDRS